MTTTTVLSGMTLRIAEEFHPLRVVLFGSRARGDTRWDSDYALLVVMPNGTDCRTTTLRILKALADAHAPKQVLVTTPEALAARPRSFANAALEEGIVLYPSSDATAGNVRRHLLANDLLPEVTRRLIEGFDPLRIILFGSRALGHARADSDYDLLVVMPNGVDRRTTAIAIHEELAGFPGDVIVTTPDEIATRGRLVGTVLKPALDEGIPVYDRS